MTSEQKLAELAEWADAMAESGMLDKYSGKFSEIAAALRASAEPSASVRGARERVIGLISDLQGEHEVMCGPFDPAAWRIDVSVSDLQTILGAAATPFPLMQAAGKAERESVAYWMTENGYATGHGDSISGMLLELISQVRERSASAVSGKAAAMPMSVADIKKQFAEFMTDLADLTVEERAAEALLAARDYIAEDNNPKSNRVLQMIKIALEDLPSIAAEPTREEMIEG